ncbi:MAG: 5-formyltetrahydrofolate cyclo-ligase [Anaerovoracaceae bacterium]|jgi:5-formyltetrahydrofolate cyclo-ligase
MVDILDKKKNIRKQILSIRNNLESNTLEELSSIAREKISSMEEFKRAKTVMSYMDFRGEVPTGQLNDYIISTGKRLVLPLTDKDFNIIPYEIASDPDWKSKSLIKSSFGILEPNPDRCIIIDPTIIDFVIVPGVAFDLNFNRLGYGKGCYDCFLPLLRKDAFKLGLAHELQVVQEIPMDSTDIRLDSICVI